MKALRHYQLDVIFLFVALFSVLNVILYFLEQAGADAHQYEWYIGTPLLIFYVVHLWRIRAAIGADDRRALTGQSLCYWIVLGMILFASYARPLAATEYWPVHVLFIAFTLLLADSYWDFRKLTLKLFWEKKDRA